MNADVAGRQVVVYDDMVRSGSSLLNAAEAYREAGASDVACVTTHGLFPGSALKRIKESGLISRVVCTNSHPRAVELAEQADGFLGVRSISRVLADVVRHIVGTTAMKLIRVATAALNQTPLDWNGNAANIRKAIESARAAGARLLCLPELCISGYGCEDAFFSGAVGEMAARVVEELLPHTGDMLVAVGCPSCMPVRCTNASAVLVDGNLAGLVTKQHLAGDGLHYEPRWFKPWPADAVARTNLADQDCPIGDLHIRVRGNATRLRDLRRRLGCQPPRTRPCQDGYRHHLQSQRKSLRLREVGDAVSIGGRGVAFAWRHLRLQQFGWKRGGPRDLRRPKRSSQRTASSSRTDCGSVSSRLASRRR